MFNFECGPHVWVVSAETFLVTPSLAHSYGCMTCQIICEMRKDSGNFTFRLLLAKRFKRSRVPDPIFRKLIPGFEKIFCYFTLRWYWVNSVWDDMRNELAIILSDDFRPIQQQLNAKRELFCIFPILQKSFRGISRHSSTFWMIDVFFYCSCIITHPAKLKKYVGVQLPKQHIKTGNNYLLKMIFWWCIVMTSWSINCDIIYYTPLTGYFAI